MRSRRPASGDCPRWADASPEERAQIVNGVGPRWAPAPVRALLTRLATAFFDEASWDHHDWGYYWGCPARAECDRRFLAAMLRDASRAGPVWRMTLANALAWLFWAAVRLGGWASYGRRARQ